MTPEASIEEASIDKPHKEGGRVADAPAVPDPLPVRVNGDRSGYGDPDMPKPEYKAHAREHERCLAQSDVYRLHHRAASRRAGKTLNGAWFHRNEIGGEWDGKRLTGLDGSLRDFERINGYVYRGAAEIEARTRRLREGKRDGNEGVLDEARVSAPASAG